MTISEIAGVIEGWFTADAQLSFLHSEEAQVNPWPIGDVSRTFPIGVLDPPSYNGKWVDFGLSKTFRIQIAFLDTLTRDHTSAQQLTIVNAMEVHAMRMVAEIATNSNSAENFDNAVIDNVQVIPVMRYEMSSHLLAGVLLYLDIEAMDTYDYCG